MKVRIYNPDIDVNDMVYISALDCCIDRRQDDSVELSNEDLRLSAVSFESILSRMTQLADLIEQKNALFSRAEAIGKDGSIYIDRLEGTINILKNRLSSSVSSWYTDANGNIVFESTTGKSAMMLTGDGFMIAAGKTATGEWNWRTFGTGEGFTADAIITGYLSADRIEARSITVDKVSSDFGATIDMSENNSVKILVGDAVSQVGDSIIYRGPTAPSSPKVNDLWLDTSIENVDLFKRWDGSSWKEATLSQEELDAIYGTLSSFRSEINILDSKISSRVTQDELNSSLANKADSDWVTKRFDSVMEQTAKDISFTFTESKKYAIDATKPFQEFVNEVKSYQRFTADGLELGKSNSPFMAKLGNTRLSFLQNGVEIAYISNNKLYITEAQVTERLSVGNSNGYFDWEMTKSGLGIKWRKA